MGTSGGRTTERPAVDLRSRSRHESKPRPVILPLGQVREPPVGLEPTPALRRLYALRAFTLGPSGQVVCGVSSPNPRGGAKAFSLTLNSPLILPPRFEVRC